MEDVKNYLIAVMAVFVSISIVVIAGSVFDISEDIEVMVNGVPSDKCVTIDEIIYCERGE